ncbi:hypothetical protein AALP_AAs51386U000100 [Arabis alpina]|uniref:Uncharacterized protein n=1 Tax=Arabis alpina TaxID=50452 RepID=A0A087G0P1_ARAAL|nr:hypothetical protein AALP_AAs51386U000100 [Arabis alpina]
MNPVTESGPLSQEDRVATPTIWSATPGPVQQTPVALATERSALNGSTNVHQPTTVNTPGVVQQGTIRIADEQVDLTRMMGVIMRRLDDQDQLTRHCPWTMSHSLHRVR